MLEYSLKYNRKQIYLFFLIGLLSLFTWKEGKTQQVSFQDSVELVEFAQLLGGLSGAAPVSSSWNDIPHIPQDSIWYPGVNPITDWYGVTWVDSAGLGLVLKVQEIDLSNLPLNTSITMIIQDMNLLEVLKLKNCGLYGPIPSSFLSSTLTNLRILDYSYNNLDFDPYFFNFMSSLFSLDELYLRNSFNPSTIDTLPSFFSFGLKLLDISENNFTGDLDFSIGSGLENLNDLYATDNQFVDINMVPNDSLRVLKISNNLFADADDLVDILENALVLEYLEANNALDTLGNTHNFTPLNSHLLSGEDLEIQMRSNNLDSLVNLEYFGDATGVYHLDLSHNQIDSIIPFLNPTVSLLYLNLSDNEISMRMTHDVLNNAPFIQYLYLHNNDFYGVKADFIDDRYESIREIDFSNNPRLTGTLDFENLLALSPAVEKLNFSNCDFVDIQSFQTGGSFPSLKELNLEGNRFHFDDLFAAVRSLSLHKDTMVIEPATGDTITQFIPDYWVNGMGQGELFDTLGVFTYWPQDSAGVGGVRRRPQADSVFFQTDVGFDPDIVNTVKWYRQKAGATLVETMGGVKASNLSAGYNNAVFSSNTTATNLTVGLGTDAPHYIRMTNLDSLIHGDWYYFAEVEHDSFPKLTINSRPKKLVIGECFDSLGARINCQQMVVQFRDTTSDETKRNLRKELGITVLDSCVCGSVELWALSDTTNRAEVEAIGIGTRKASSQASTRAELLSADPNYLLLEGAAGQSTNPPSFAQGTTNDSPVLIAIIDSGVDLDNPKLKKRIWVNTEDNNNDGQDNDNDCEVDNGWGWNYLDRNNNTDDDHGHGTIVATVATGLNPANELANFGEDDDIAIVPYKYTNAKGTGSVFEATCAVYQASNYADPLPNGDTARVRVINASWGYYGEPCVALENAIKYSGEQCGILFIASAGNDNENTSVAKHWPSNSPWPDGDSLGLTFNDNVIAVGAYDEANPDVLASYSNYSNQHIDLLADGTVQGYRPNGDTSNLITQSGTSFAAPLVARAAALLFHEFPEASYGAVKQAILEGVDSLQSADAAYVSSGGRLNYTKARQILLNMEDRHLCLEGGYVVGIEENELTGQELMEIYPNPFHQNLKIELNQNILNSDQAIRLRLMSIDGRILTEQIIDKRIGVIQFNTSDWANGMYLIHLQQGTKQQIQKIVKFQ